MGHGHLVAGRHLVAGLLTLACILHQPQVQGHTDDATTKRPDADAAVAVPAVATPLFNVTGAWLVPPSDPSLNAVLPPPTPGPPPPPPPPRPTPGAASTATPQRGGRTETAMLGYIFDTHSTANKHHHHHQHGGGVGGGAGGGDAKWGPHFEDAAVEAGGNVTVQAGDTATLHCLISMLQDKTVSWVRRGGGGGVGGGGGGGLQLLTVGRDAYAGDPRFQIHFQYPNDWRLRVVDARKHDEGVYECQISTHPPKVIRVNLHVNAPEVLIVDEHGRRLQDKYYEVDSTIQLTCLVRHVAMATGGQVLLWTHGALQLNYDVTRGGISVRTDLTEEGAVSILAVARINKADSGNYTCAINAAQFATVNVHVLNGESIAELHDGGGSGFRVSRQMALLCLIVSLASS